MTSVHFSENVVREQAKTAAKKKTRKYVVVGAIAAVAVIPSAAYALITGIFGTGDVDVAAGEVQQMTVNTSFVENTKLFPGTQAAVKFRVSNPNPFPIEVDKVMATGFSSSNCSAASELAWFSGPVSALNTNVNLAPVAIPANDSAVVTVPDGIKLSTDATKSCAYKLSVKVTGAQKAS